MTCLRVTLLLFFKSKFPPCCEQQENAKKFSEYFHIPGAAEKCEKNCAYAPCQRGGENFFDGELFADDMRDGRNQCRRQEEQEVNIFGRRIICMNDECKPYNQQTAAANAQAGQDPKNSADT